jgi:hypothetical protein
MGTIALFERLQQISMTFTIDGRFSGLVPVYIYLSLTLSILTLSTHTLSTGGLHEQAQAEH